ncbi:MAG: hypothetical protein U9R48_06880 [Chloroflexota bacterium]|nr:hypothetical protein [Chloroflexota bacterium]
MKRFLPVTAAVACGGLALLDFFFDSPHIDAAGTILVEGVTILAAFALLLGLLNILAVHLRRVASGGGDRGASLVLVLALLITTALGISMPDSPGIDWVFGYIYSPLQSTMTALLAFFVASAAYRAFKIRDAAAAILLISSLFVLFAQLPFSASLSPYIPSLRHWVFKVPVTASMRGLLFGIALGTITTSLRILLAVDKPYARSQEPR